MSDVDNQEEMFEGANVSKIEDGAVHASLTAFAKGLGTSRETLQDRLVKAGVVARGKRQGYSLYALHDVLQAWLSGPEARVDPDALTPFQRRAWYQGEHEKLKLQIERGELVPAIEVEQTLGELAKLFARGMDTLIDTVERDVGLSAPQARKLEQHVDQVREIIYQAVAGEPDAADRATVKVQTSAPAGETRRASRGTPSGSALEEAIAFLRQALAGGARPTAELVTAAKETGISHGTLRRAKAQLGEEVVALRQGKGWVWSIDAPAPDKSLNLRKP